MKRADLPGIRRQPGAGTVFVAMVCALYLFNSLAGFQFADYDLFARLAVGRLFFAFGSVAHQDVFSFSPTKTIWYDHEWLAGVFYYAVLHSLGSAALFFLSALSMLLTFALLLAAIRAEQRLQQRSLLPAVLLLFFVGLMSIGMWAAVIRAQVGSFLFFAMLLWLLISGESPQRSKRRYLIPLVFLLWINFHGGCIVGYGLLGLTCFFSLLERREGCFQLAAIGIVSLLMLLLNPYGIGYLGFLVEAIGKERPLIDEWGGLPLNPMKIIGRGYGGFLPFAVLIPILSVVYRKRVRAEGIIFTLFALWYGANHVRLLPFFFMAAAVFYAPAYLALLERLPATLRSATRTALIALVCLYSPVALWNSTHAIADVVVSSLPLRGYPVAAMQWLRCNYASGKVLSSFNAGSYVLWQGYPEFLVAIDGRYEEVYEDEVVQRVVTAFSRRHPQRDSALAEVNPDFVILCAEERERVLPEMWRLVFEADSCAVHALPSLAPAQQACDEADSWTPHF